MQVREYENQDGLKIWLSERDVSELLETVEGEPRRRIALALGLHGLRTDELVSITPGHVRELDGGGHVLSLTGGKTGRRDVPLSPDLQQRIHYLSNAAQLRKDEPVVNVGKRQVRNWIDSARDSVAESEYPHRPEWWGRLSMHDLRRTWATGSYYGLAIRGVPIAEQLVMSWGGWAQTESGRDTFRSAYLGPVPDYVVNEVREDLPHS